MFFFKQRFTQRRINTSIPLGSLYTTYQWLREVFNKLELLFQVIRHKFC